jgi:hypothetical protein
MSRILSFFLFVFLCISGKGATVEARYDYPQNPYISEAVWETVKPYLLPSNHRIKHKLDKIFKASRATLNEKQLKKAGFTEPYHRRYNTKIVVSRHKEIPGYLVKLYTDDQVDIVDYSHLIHRIRGAQSIKNSIEKHGYEKYFKVPRKWLYPLPPVPSPLSAKGGKNFILVVEDMQILSRRSNYDKWKGKVMTKDRARAIFTVMKENELKDTIQPFNLPFCRDGKMAFIDTEHHHSGAVAFQSMTRHLPRSVRSYWEELISGSRN